MAVYSVVIVTSMLGNGAVVFIVWREKHMRTTTNYFIVNLAVCGVMVTSLSACYHVTVTSSRDELTSW